MVSPNGIRTWYLYVPIVNTIVVDFSRLKLTVFCVFQFFFMDLKTPLLCYMYLSYWPLGDTPVVPLKKLGSAGPCVWSQTTALPN